MLVSFSAGPGAPVAARPGHGPGPTTAGAEIGGLADGEGAGEAAGDADGAGTDAGAGADGRPEIAGREVETAV